MKYSKQYLPRGEWRRYVKKSDTKMLRIDGPFEVETPHGTVTCTDGYLAIDASGVPYPIAADVQRATYIDLGEAT